MSNPTDIQQDIEQTRQELSTDVNRLAEKVSPPKIVARRVDRVKSAAGSAKERVMGSAPDPSRLRDATSSVGSSVSSAASTVGDAASSAPQAVQRQTQGNPLAAGMIAFGVGWLLSSLAPASQQEQQLAQAAEDKAKELAGPVKERASEVAANLKEPLQQSAEQIKSTARDAAAQTTEQARSATEDVKQPLQR